MRITLFDAPEDDGQFVHAGFDCSAGVTLHRFGVWLGIYEHPLEAGPARR
jgi:hypothetical protein